ncbi:hypothetical protein CPI83_28675 [Rhodococcus sp. H-CA8f]|uniref:DUF2326 domain-containing protein n=1 Tax=Rhodococcus sp. H-CA8f TaxID=1727214 RepID=UPI000BE3E2DC|nr:DUF2326 domain-containing protein [Rhodococcus sp. H-CA8f]ATI35603.1 hypothetical protein CPI83_28675 [Rhodococcus sp. H-CA8f]
MLHRISSNKKEFQPIKFVSGLNLIVADRAPGASEQHSRNARGKTSVIRAINYCLGSSKPIEFKPLADSGWAFTLELDLFESRVWATRGVKGETRVSITTSGGRADVVLEDYLREDGTISLSDWKFLLGLGLFGLDQEVETNAQSISPRTLLSYVIRLDAPKDPTKTFAAQPAWSSREHVAFLLGLDWQYTQKLSRMEQDENAFKALTYAQNVQLVPGLMEDESELILRRTETERELAAVTRQAEEFNVLEDPQGVLEQANQVAAEITSKMDDQISAERLLMLYNESMHEPEESADDLVGDVYRELGLIFSPDALRRFEQVELFHSGLLRNRSRFIQAEIERLERQINDRRPEIDALQDERQNLLRQLSSGGGLDDLLELQRRVMETTSQLQNLDGALKLIRRVFAAEDALKVSQATCRRDAREDLNRDRDFLDMVNTRFSEMISYLYGKSGSITVEVDKLGYKFTIKVASSSSTGITKMKLFVFDLTLMEQSRKNRHPHFLIHDSVVFDGVDPRQIAGAINLARTSSEAAGTQYIATLNSNDVPDSISNAEWYHDCVRRVILDTEVGGAFGIEF